MLANEEFFDDAKLFHHPLLEIFRLKMMMKMVDTIFKLNNGRMKRRQIHEKLADILTDTRLHCECAHTLIVDPIFNIPTDKIVKFYGIKQDVSKMISEIIPDLQEFKKKIKDKSSKIFVFEHNRFVLSEQIMKEYDLNKVAGLLNKLFYNATLQVAQQEQMLCCLIRSITTACDNRFVDPKYITELSKHGLNFECFGSAINDSFTNFCSDWLDIDEKFGGRGNICHFELKKGFYFATPKTNNQTIYFYNKMKRALQDTHAHAQPCCFIVNIQKKRFSKCEKEINKDKLFLARKLKYEYWVKPQVIAQGSGSANVDAELRPPYLSYIFATKNYPKIDEIKKSFNTFRNYNLEFPARNTLYDEKYKIMIFNKLLGENLEEVIVSYPKYYDRVKIPQTDYLYQGQYHFLVSDDSKYQYYLLSDLFNDTCRSKCSFGGKITPDKFFEQKKYALIEKMINQGLEINPINLRNEIYLSTMECSTHNPLIIKHFIKMFAARKVLDFSSGWGDRLIGALLSDIDLYVGVDPNACLHPGYQAMIKLFNPLCPNPKAKFIMNLAPFQDYEFKDETDTLFDLVYTSPPYFDYEDYTSSKTQSMHQYNSENGWLENFLYVAVDKVTAKLRMGGHMVLYISQEYGKTYVEKLLARCKLQSNLYYLGNMFKADVTLKKMHPIYIFEKNDTIPVELYNPPIIIDKIHDKVRLNIVRDDLLIGGTKVRASVLYLQQFLKENLGITELIYTGASNGYGQVAIAYSLYLLKTDIKLVIYNQPTKLSYVDKIQKITLGLYPNTEYIPHNGTMSDIWGIIDNRIKNNPRAMEIPFGLGSAAYKKILDASLSVRLQEYISNIKRLWLVGGSSTVFQVLYNILPNTHFMLVTVGKKIVLEDKYKSRTSLLVSKYKLYEDIPYEVKYPTVQSYDAKVWEFRDQFQRDDYIWNVAGIHNLI